jgi:cephalosporin-C deacetylase-like acetyl esterase
MPGQILLLMGEDLTHYFVGDGMRAIDYLLARPEVDPKRIGCAGHSGGATQTRFISALDSRVSCAAVNQDGTGHRWPISSRPGGRLGLSDIEQNAFPAALDGIDNCDMLTAIAPRPLLLTIENYSPAFHTTAGHLKQRYRQLGAEEKFATEEANDPHSWTAKLRLATADWFSRCYYGRPGPDREPDLEPERAETLRCTPAGSLREARKGDSIFTIIAAKGGRITPERPVPSGKTELDSFRAQMLGQIRKLIRYDATAHPLGARHISTTPRRGYQVEHVEFLSEPGIYIPAWVFKPERRDGGPPTVFVHEAGKQVEGLEFGRLEKLARKGRLIVAVDVRGIGETEPRYQASDRTGDFGHLFNVETGLAYSAWYLDQSLFGMRVRDVVRSVEYALSRPDANASGARLVGKGAGALWCLFAAALESRVAELVAENGLISYRSLTTVDRYRHGAAVFVPDILKHFDLPQVAAIIASRNVTLVSPVDPMKRHLDLAAASEAYSWTRQVFEKAGAVDRFRIVAQMEL